MKAALIHLLLFGLIFEKGLCHGTKIANAPKSTTKDSEDPVQPSYSTSSGKVALSTIKQNSHQIHTTPLLNSSNSSSDSEYSANKKQNRRMIQSYEKNSFARLNTQVSHFSHFDNDFSSSGRTLPTLFFMGLFGTVEFIIVSGLCIAIFFPVIFNLLIMLHFMFKSSLIMLG